MTKCEACGFDLVTVQHHPDGREENLIIGNDGRLLRVDRIPVDPDNVVVLCPNCHALVHWKKKSVDRAGFLTKKFWREKVRIYEFLKYERMWSGLKIELMSRENEDILKFMKKMEEP